MYRISACMTMSDNLSVLASSRVNNTDIRTDRLRKWARLSNLHCGGTPLQGKHADIRPQTVKVKTGAVVLRCDAVRVDSWTEFEFLVDISRMSHHRTATAPPPRRRVVRPYRSRVGAIKETIRGNDPRCRVSDAWTAIPESADTKTLLNRQARLSNGEEGNWFLSPSLPGSVLIAKPVSRGLQPIHKARCMSSNHGSYFIAILLSTRVLLQRGLRFCHQKSKDAALSFVNQASDR